MKYRICKSFHVETGHVLSKHPGRCRFPHGHSRRVDVVVASDRLDERDMVCDFKAIKLALSEYLDQFDHALAVNSRDPLIERLKGSAQRLVVFDNVDPTTEVLAKRLFDHLSAAIAAGQVFHDAEGGEYPLPRHLVLERVRVTETPTSWAEYGL